MAKPLSDRMAPTPINVGDRTPAPVSPSAPPVRRATKRAAAAPSAYYASVYPGADRVIPSEFAEAVLALEKILSSPIWLLIHHGSGKFGVLEDDLVHALLAEDLSKKAPITLLIDSPGGSAKCAYQLAMILKRHCGKFTAVVPRYAKSAATLLTLAADSILLGTDAELGPLDAQVIDREREEWMSALDEVQSLERLHAFALEAVDRSMFLMIARTDKKIETLLPVILRFVADLVHPLFAKIDAVHYTRLSRALKVAEEYAIRMLQTKYPLETAREIARHLVEHYPDHEFIIDAAEAKTFGLETTPVPAKEQRLIDSLVKYLPRMIAIGRVKKVTGHGTSKRH